MLYYIKWTFILTLFALLGAIAHYTLPQHDIVRIVNVETKRVDFGGFNALFYAQPMSGDADNFVNRDIFFIHAVKPNGDISVYRNEDTGWGWPPYFKFDTTNMQAQAADWESTLAEPIWVAIKHYGWRNRLISIFPNALKLRQVDGPDVFIFPTTTVIVLFLFGSLFWFVAARVRRFRKRRIDPVLDEVDEQWDRAGSWFSSWRGPKQRR